MKNNTRAALTLIAFSTPFVSMNAHSAGLQLMPGSPNFGTAGAGHAAAGFGASSAWANPATMVLVEGQQIGFGIIAAETDIEFNPDDPNGTGANAGGNLYIPSFAYVNSINENISVGFSMVVPYGNSLSYGDDWDGSNVATDVSLETIQAMPSIAYRINEKFSIGFGISANHTSVTQDLKINVPLPGMGIHDTELEADSIDYGYTIGGLYEINDNHRLGFVYRSQVDSDLNGKADISEGGKLSPLNGSYDTSLDWVNPASIVFSGVHQVSEKTSLLWDVGRTFYSAFETTDVSLEDAPISGLPTIHRNWEDAERYAIGAQYQLNDKMILQAGYAYETSVVSDEDRSVDLPLDKIQRYTAGILYQMNTSTSLGFGIEYANLGDAKIINDPSTAPLDSPSGSYDSSALAASFSVNYQF